MAPNLLPDFAEYLVNHQPLEASKISEGHPLLLDHVVHGGKRVQMVYAPFDHVNLAAKIVVVGMTPGAYQAENAQAAAASALRSGKSLDEASRMAKAHASFSGEPMRSNLVAMLDNIGVASLLGLQSTESLWSTDSNLVHFTSALRYPVFIDGKNWSGSPDMVRTPRLREWLLKYTGAELSVLREALIVPLGPKVAAAMKHLAGLGMIESDLILDGLPHPSGANAERIAYFLGRKHADKLSSKTNPVSLDTARDALRLRVARLAA